VPLSICLSFHLLNIWNTLASDRKHHTHLPQVLDDRLEALGPNLQHLREVPHHRGYHERLETDLRPVCGNKSRRRRQRVQHVPRSGELQSQLGAGLNRGGRLPCVRQTGKLSPGLRSRCVGYRRKVRLRVAENIGRVKGGNFDSYAFCSSQAANRSHIAIGKGEAASREKPPSPEVVNNFYDVVLHLDGQEVRVDSQHRRHVVVRPRQRFAVVRDLRRGVCRGVPTTTVRSKQKP